MPSLGTPFGRVAFPGKALLCRRVFLGKIFQLIKFFAGFAGDYCSTCQFCGASEIFSDSAEYQGGSGVGNGNIELRPGFACQKGKDEVGIFLRGAASDGFERGARNTEVFWGDDESPDAAVADFGDLRFAGERNFVKSARAVNDESAKGAKFGEGSGDGVDHVCGEDSEDLGFGACGIRERAEQIKNGAPSDLQAGWCGVAGGGVGCGSKEKADADFADGAASGGHGKIDAHAEGFENIRGAAAGTNGPVAMLGDVSARRGGDNCGGGRDIEGAGFVATRAAGVDKSREPRFVCCKYRGGVPSDDAGEPG